jgi:hypothetical protein
VFRITNGGGTRRERRNQKSRSAGIAIKGCKRCDALAVDVIAAYESDARELPRGPAMRVTIFVGALALPLIACGGPSIEAFNDRGGVISYHMVNSNMADVLAVAERYCSQLGRKAKLGSSSMGMTAMNVNFECVE